MHTIEITNVFSIRYDGVCYILYEKRQGINEKTGEPKTSSKISYFPRIEHCFLEIINRVPAETKNIQGILDSIKEATDRIIEEVKKIDFPVGDIKYWKPKTVTKKGETQNITKTPKTPKETEPQKTKTKRTLKSKL